MDCLIQVGEQNVERGKRRREEKKKRKRKKKPRKVWIFVY